MFIDSLQKDIETRYGKSVRACSDKELYAALLRCTTAQILDRPQPAAKKKLYYISMEFLVGRILHQNLMNLGVYDAAQAFLSKNGHSLPEILAEEREPSLGNGGLGRLAACFLDSIATLELPGEGIGLAYHFGLFRQLFVRNAQRTVRDAWITPDSVLERTERTFDVAFGSKKVKARLYNLHIAGYERGRVTLRLFDLETVDESIVRRGSITFDKTAADKNLTLFLYPDDSDEAGNLLRIYQEYFLCSCAAQYILADCKERGYKGKSLGEHAAVQINDTHPTLVIPELIRLLTEQEGLRMDEAVKTVTKACAYTNHTILAEALETWPLKYLKKVVPQLIPVIRELDARVKASHTDRNVQIIDAKKRVHMAYIDIHYGHSVNGVAALHTEILKNSELNAFYRIYPKKFNNKTNGITLRRWLMQCNPELDAYLTTLIGDGYKRDADALKKLLSYRDDAKVLKRLAQIKQTKKRQLADYMLAAHGIAMNTDAIFDIQAKRMHEYKRQQMNALYIIHKYLEIKRGVVPKRPLTCIFGAKAAPAYTIAQDIIHLILVLQQIISEDKEARDHLRVVMVPNYNVSVAEKLIPACDISEQISLASKEASGTGNMKFMLNGAVTLGTDDGANVEIHDLVGDENIYIFGVPASEVIDHYRNEDYVSRRYYEDSPVIREAVDFILSDACLAAGSGKRLRRLHKELVGKDYFMTLIDLEEYIEVKERMLRDYDRAKTWRQMMLTNIAMAGFFSSDRTIAEYNRDIWKLTLDNGR